MIMRIFFSVTFILQLFFTFNVSLSVFRSCFFKKFKFLLHDSSDQCNIQSCDSVNDNRLWMRKMSGNMANLSLENLHSNIDDIFHQNGIQPTKLELAILLLPSVGVAVPIKEGKAQLGNTLEFCIAENTPVVYGFSPRSKHVAVAPSEEFQVDQERFDALNGALRTLVGIDPEDLSKEPFAYTSPARIYRSFVCPKKKPSYLVESLSKAANRTAAQIGMAFRQVRADQASYLRNTDQITISNRTINPVVLVLDNIRSALNVGSLFRTAGENYLRIVIVYQYLEVETGGVKELITCGITAHPPHPKLYKTAFSSIDSVSHRHFDDVVECVKSLKDEGFTIVAMETTSRSQDYSKLTYPEKTALILGNEVTGVDTTVMDMADMIVEIPTYGIKNSLNVASAAPVVLFEILRQWHTTGSK